MRWVARKSNLFYGIGTVQSRADSSCGLEMRLSHLKKADRHSASNGERGEAERGNERQRQTERQRETERGREKETAE